MKKILFVLLFVIVFIITGFIINVNINRNEFQIPVLMYHQVMYDEDYIPEVDTIRYSVLEEQFKYFKENNIEPISMDEFYCWKQGKCKLEGKKVVLTFDDGFYSFHYIVEPLLKEYGFNATNFVIGEVTPEVTPKYDPTQYGTVGMDVINNHSKNVEYGSHTYGMHKYIDGKRRITIMSESEMQEDFDNMKKIGNFKYMSYPFNTDNKTYIKLLKKNKYRLAFRNEAEKAIKRDNDYRMPRINVNEDMNEFKNIFETKKYNNRYGSGLVRKVLVTIERKLGIRII